MAFCPNESSVDNFGLVQSFYFLQQQSQKFLTVSIASNPWWSHISVTESTEIDNGLFCNADSYVSFGNSTGRTDVSDGWNELYTTHWT